MTFDHAPSRSFCMRLAALAALGLAAVAATPAAAADTTLTETGSTLLQPLFEVWAAAYAKTHPGVDVSVAGTGSQAGIDQAISGKAQIGASDAYMSDAAVKQNPQILNIALAISAQKIVYNVPGLSAPLKLDGPTLAAIYSGTITRWNDSAIAALNPGASLPDQAIVPVRRSEGSGDTFLFTQFLTFSTPSWEDNVGYGTTIAWPTVSGSVAVAGNEGVVKAIQAKPYSIGYVGVSYSGEIDDAKLGVALLKSEDGDFVSADKGNIEAAADSLTPRTPADERLTLAFAPGPHSYPLVNYEYAMVSTNQASPEIAAALRRFLLWAIVPSETKESYLDKVDFIPLPPHTWDLSQAQIQQIK
jgi:phosphate transport system substrate-binding protein